jgi:hypothetical protein
VTGISFLGRPYDTRDVNMYIKIFDRYSNGSGRRYPAHHRQQRAGSRLELRANRRVLGCDYSSGRLTAPDRWPV